MFHIRREKGDKNSRRSVSNQVTNSFIAANLRHWVPFHRTVRHHLICTSSAARRANLQRRGSLVIKILPKCQEYKNK